MASSTVCDDERRRAVEDVKVEIVERWRALCGAEAELLASVHRYAELDGPVVDQSGTVAATLVFLLGCAGATARQLARAATVVTCGGVADGLASGALTRDHVATLAKRGASADNVDRALELDADDLAVALRRERQPTPDDERDAHDRRGVRLRVGDDGDLIGSFRLPGVDGATVRGALERRAAGFGPDPLTGLYDSHTRQLADALVELCGLALGEDADSDRATISVGVDGASGRAWLDDGTFLGPDTLQRLLCDCRLEAVLTSGPGEPYRFSMVRRTASPAQVRALRHRQHGECATLGCHQRLHLHAHHLTHWTRGGPTVMANLVLVCRRCHHRYHEGGWTLTGTPDDLVVHRPGGALWEPPWKLRTEPPDPDTPPWQPRLGLDDRPLIDA